jgi:hypothetical protein
MAFQVRIKLPRWNEIVLILLHLLLLAVLIEVNLLSPLRHLARRNEVRHQGLNLVLLPATQEVRSGHPYSL